MNKRKLLLTSLLAFGGVALAFCGFYVAKADTELFNETSKVVIAKDGPRTILTMANDFSGDVEDFALVVPVPTVLTQEQIQVGDLSTLERLDAYSAPRLVEYFDDDPCALQMAEDSEESLSAPMPASAQARANALGVTIEEAFSVGEYDILILSAEESEGLTTWLIQNGYVLPEAVVPVLQRYIQQGMKFFVARVNLEAFEASGYEYLRPLIMAFESERFMLPIQLGMVNARGPQDLVVYLLSPQGRVETTNYPVVTIPTDVTLPEYVEDDFGAFYRAMFERAYEREGRDAVFLEYAWDMAWCDPCAADPLSPEELRRAGVFWLDERADMGAPNVYLTRLHVRYTPEEFPEDLMFRTTNNRDNFQGRYVLQRPFEGELTCAEGEAYVEQVRERREEEAKRLANLTGWDVAEVRAQVGDFDPAITVAPWWERVFDSFERP